MTAHCFSTNNNFLAVRKAGQRLFIRRDADSDELRKLLDSPDFFLKNTPDILKDSRTTKAALITLENGTGVFLKRYNNKGFIYTLRYLFRRSRAERSFKNSWRMEELEIPTPKAIAALTIRHFGILQCSYIVHESIDGVLDTLDLFRKTLELETFRTLFFEIISEYAACMHNAGFIHGDLKMSNIYCLDDFKSFGIWDLDGMKSGGNAAERSKEIARFISSYIEIGSRLGISVNIKDSAKIFISSYNPRSDIKADLDTVLALTKTFLEKYS